MLSLRINALLIYSRANITEYPNVLKSGPHWINCKKEGPTPTSIAGVLDEDYHIKRFPPEIDVIFTGNLGKEQKKKFFARF